MAVSRRLSILLIDDNPAVARALEIMFRIAGHDLDIARAPDDAFSRLAQRRYDAILLDMNFTPGRSNGEEGLACLSRIMTDTPGARVIVMTAHSGVRIAVAAMRAGARDFVVKPWRNADLLAKVEEAVGSEPAPAVPTARAAPSGVNLLGRSDAMERVRALIRRVGPTAASVCVTGQPGSGRSLASAALHAVSVDAASAPLKIDLRDGDQWQRLDGGTGTVILRHPDRLDEIAQARLLSRLPAHVRTIAIADRTAPLVPALYHRLCAIEIVLPPLAQRGNDAVLLARHFARVSSEAHGLAPVAFTPAAEAAIAAQTLWPDEVRGLALAVERAVLLSDGAAIEPVAIVRVQTGAASDADENASFDLGRTERAMIENVLRQSRHNVSRAATTLGLSRQALYRRMARHGL